MTASHDATLPITTQGTTVITWTYDDGNGNTATQTQNVVITPTTIWYADADADGYGNDGSKLIQCTQPTGYVSDHSDCDDTDANVYPGAPALADGKDNNCDGVVDKVDQTITIEAIADQITTAGAITVTASASSALSVTLGVTGPASINGNVITLDGAAGTVTVTASQAGNSNYNAAADVTISFNVTDPCSDFSVALTSTTDETTGNDGVADITVSGGTAPFVFSWSNGTELEDLSGVSAGEYTVTVTDANSCTQTLTVTIDETVTGTEKDLKANVRFYPNPAASYLTIDATFAKPTDVVLQIMDLSGRALLTKTKKDIQQLDENWDLSTLHAGQYLLMITADQKQQIERIIKH